MIQIVYDLIHHRHPWRAISNNQLSELYLSMMVKSLAISLIGIFIPVYLYQLGYAISEIALYGMLLFGMRIITDNVIGYLVGEFGPKHMMVLSHVFLIILLSMFASLEEHRWPLHLLAVLDGLGMGMFYVSYHVDFSKIQSVKHAGAQIGTMFRLVKLSSAIGPFIGGLIATMFGVPYVLYASIALILISIIPLVMGPEPVRKHQHISIKGFPWHKIKWDLASNLGLGADQMASVYVWPLFVSVFIFVDNVYLGVGFVTSVGLIVSFMVTKAYGRLLDARKGKILLRYAIFGQSVTHLIRPLLSSSGAVFVFNLVNDPMQVGVRMPYTKGVYDAASSYEGYRIVYICTIMTTANIMRTLTFILMYLVAINWNDKLALQSVFIFAAILIWLVSLQRYKASR